MGVLTGDGMGLFRCVCGLRLACCLLSVQCGQIAENALFWLFMMYRMLYLESIMNRMLLDDT